MIDYLINLDSEALLWLNSFHTQYLDRFMMLFTGRFVWIPMYATLLYVFSRMFNPRQVLILVIGIALAITLSDQTVASLLRPIFQRLRPANLDNPLSALVQVVDGYRGGRYGFPSCHGANSFALVAFTAWIIPRSRYIIFITVWAIINCYTRNYLGVHYPGDILVGAIIGVAFGTLCAWGACRVGSISLKMREKRSYQPLIGGSHGATSRIMVYDVTVITGIVTAIILAIAAAVQVYFS
ncbi:MAG: phosphatase PAP2 family protein [Lachnoclostridium sp.]|nr:phosphatase PAP2 family protein [Lachnoclostridium sp.]